MMIDPRLCDTCGVDISHKHRFSRYCDAHTQAKPERKVSPKQAIGLHCKDCIYDELDVGNWKQQVTACEFTKCNLYPFRPISKKPLPEVS